MSTLPERVFDDWRLETICAYGRENDLEYTRNDYFSLIAHFPDPPVGFLSIDGRVRYQDAYWNKKDIKDDIAIYQADGYEAEATLALQHDEMCEFLSELIDELLYEQ